MDDASNIKMKCPGDEETCKWFSEIKNLREQVEELSELVSTDALTGLYNFRHFNKVLQAEMDRSKRSGIPTSLVMVDIDFFKKVNDEYGHEVGNQALQFVSDILVAEVRTTDVVCRYGGEEFAIVFPETHLNMAVKVADRIRETIDYSILESGENKIHLTASMGASVYLKTSVISLEEFIDSADQYLYEAKQSGRNCICHIDFSDLRKVTEVSLDERAMLFNIEQKSLKSLD
jgi:diguanylate cyclase (GGDEF)-like protein